MGMSPWGPLHGAPRQGLATETAAQGCAAWVSMEPSPWRARVTLKAMAIHGADSTPSAAICRGAERARAYARVVPLPLRTRARALVRYRYGTVTVTDTVTG